MTTSISTQLAAFQDQYGFKGKGPLSVALHVTRYAREHGLPIKAEDLRTGGGGQVKGLGQGRIKRILADHGVTRNFASEGGRTSRNSLRNMENYVSFLNSLGSESLEEVEGYWVEQVQEYFRSKPFTLTLDPTWSFEKAIQMLLEQVLRRQQEGLGVPLLGTVLQHLIGAKLEIALGGDGLNLEHHGASVADSPTRRPGDFKIDDTVIHVTTLPTQALLEKCSENLASGYRPIIVTLFESVAVGRGIATSERVRDRVDIVPAEQFIVANLYEWSQFQNTARATTLAGLVDKYNQIVDHCETDPSLRIEFGG